MAFYSSIQFSSVYEMMHLFKAMLSNGRLNVRVVHF